MRSMRVVKRTRKKERETERKNAASRARAREREREQKKMREQRENCGRARERVEEEERREIDLFPSRFSRPFFSFFFSSLFASFFLLTKTQKQLFYPATTQEREAQHASRHGRILGRVETQRHLARLVDRAHSRVDVYFRCVSKGGLREK